MQSISQHSAKDSLIGYLYQCRLALLEVLKRLPDDPDVNVAIETLDDIVISNPNKGVEIIQAKHHGGGKLSDKSVDFWKTIKIWCDCLSRGYITESTVLYLMTTQEVLDNSTLSFLRTQDRNIQEAEIGLLGAARKSKNKKNKEACQLFMNLTSEKRNFILGKIYILDNCPNNNEIEESLAKVLWGHCDRQHTKSLLEHLEGWWFAQMYEKISTNHDQYIKGKDIERELSNLREKFKQDSLPIDSGIESKMPDKATFLNKRFVQQLQLIRISDSRILTAIKDFYKASEQRSRWVRCSLSLDNELEEYDDKLKDDWHIRFEQEADTLVELNEDMKISSGRNIYKWVEAEADVPIRSQSYDKFITRGSYHMLADKLTVGWHPDFKLLMDKSKEVAPHEKME